MEDKRKIIAERIKERRLALKLTQKELASALNVTFQTISKYETCINIPDAETLNKLSELLQCSSDYLLGKTNDIDIYMSKNNDVILKISEDCEYYSRRNSCCTGDIIIRTKQSDYTHCDACQGRYQQNIF